MYEIRGSEQAKTNHFIDGLDRKSRFRNKKRENCKTNLPFMLSAKQAFPALA